MGAELLDQWNLKVHRRNFLLLFGGCPLGAALAQLTVGHARVGILFARPRTDGDIQAFLAELKRAGYEEGKNLTIDFAQVEPSKFAEVAREFVNRKVDLIYAPTTAAAVAARTVTGVIPIVFATAHEPVEVGLVKSFAHPGGNVTGMSSFNSELASKRLELLKEFIPGLARVAVLRRPLTKENIPAWNSAITAARALDLALDPLDVSTPMEIDSAIKATRNGRAQALLILDDAFTSSQWNRIATQAIEVALPSNSTWRSATEFGVLFSYGPSIVANYRRAAGYVAAILKGAKPSDLPVEQPKEFELVVNLKTARSIGIAVPPSLLARADDVIQ